MRLLLIGAPGAGKGTQAELLARRFGLAHISSGDLLRQHVRDRTSLGQAIRSYVDRGDLVPDGVVMDMLRKPVVAAAEAGGYVLDGFPRTVEQAQASFPTARALGAEVQAAIHLDVAREELVRRLLSRGRGSDDTEAIIENSLQGYLDKTVPLLHYYAGREWMFTVDGGQPPDAVHANILGRLQKLANLTPLGAMPADRGRGRAGRARLSRAPGRGPPGGHVEGVLYVGREGERVALLEGDLLPGHGDLQLPGQDEDELHVGRQRIRLFPAPAAGSM